MLKPQDIVILLKIISTQAKDKINPLPQKDLATYLCMSASEISEGTKRLLLSGLLAPVSKEIGGQNIIVRTPVKAACEECLISGVF